MKAPSERHFIHGGTFVLANRMQAVGDRCMGDITSKQWMLLVAVQTSDEDAPNLTSLAKDLGSSRQNVRTMLNGLEKRGYVALELCPGDHRSHTVRLTPKAGLRMGAVSRVGQRYIDRLFQGVSEEQVQVVAGVFRKMFANLDAMEGEQL